MAKNEYKADRFTGHASNVDKIESKSNRNSRDLRVQKRKQEDLEEEVSRLWGWCRDLEKRLRLLEKARSKERYN